LTRSKYHHQIFRALRDGQNLRKSPKSMHFDAQLVWFNVSSVILYMAWTTGRGSK